MRAASHHYVETIFALSSGALPAGLAVIRLSGADVRFGLETLTGSVPPARQACLRTIRNRNNLELDRGIVLFFPQPASFTGEDCAELHVHGGRAVVSAVMQALRDIDGFRQAEAGEFTRRAFENGRIDLTAVEGLADLISAQTEMQRRLALEQAQGGPARLYDGWAKRLTHERALIEAGLDFADEGDVPDGVAGDVGRRLEQLAGELENHLCQGRASEMVREGMRVVIAGAPNAGKSTLMNALARRPVSIVSDEPGTTRDIVSVTLDLGGYIVHVQDTAGLRDDAGKVEREGIRRARDAMATADVVLYLHDLSNPAGSGATELPVENGILVGSKADLVESDADGPVDIRLSAETGEGVEDLLGLLEQKVGALAGVSGQMAPMRERHRQQIQLCLAHVQRVVASPDLAGELVAEELRAAAEALGRITGWVDVEDLLDVIFGSFCIGK